MRKLLQKIWSDESGNTLIVAGASLPLFLGAAGLATDTIQWTLWKRQLQRAADSAAIAGVYERIQVGDNKELIEDAVGDDIDLNHHTGIALHEGFPKVTVLANDPEDEDIVLRVQVDLQVSRPLAFSGLFLKDAPDIRATATAASVPGSDEYCVVSLEDTAETGITGSGNGTIVADCGYITNSIAANSAIAKGSAIIKGTVIASVGGIEQSDNWFVSKYDPYVSKQPDPYKNVNPNPDDMNCDLDAGGDSSLDADSGKGNDKGTITSVALTSETDLDGLVDAAGNPINCFSSLSVASNTSLTLPAGTYYINGGDVNIQGTLTATEGTTIVLTNLSTEDTATIGNLTMHSSAKLNINAPADGPFKGIAVYQDRRATNKRNVSPNKINGNSESVIQGSLYFPNQSLTYNGGGTTTAVCTRFVTRRIIFSGNSGSTNTIKRDCDDVGVDTFSGGRLIRLIG